MNESIKVHYEVEKTSDVGTRKYVFTHPYAAPADEAFAALEEVKQYLLVRVSEIQNLQAGQTPEIEPQVQQPEGN